MASGFAVVGAVAASWGFAKDIMSFCKRYHDSKTDIPAVFLRFENDTVLLGSLNELLTQEVLQRLDDESVDHLQRVFSYLLPILQSTWRQLQKHKSVSKWDRLKWTAVGKDLTTAEHAMYEWIDRTQKCLVLLPNTTKTQLLHLVGDSPSVDTTRAQMRMEESIANFRRKSVNQPKDLAHSIEAFHLAPSFSTELTPFSGGKMMTIDTKRYLVEWKRLPVSDSGSQEHRMIAEHEIGKLVSILSMVDAARMFLMRAVKYFVSTIEPTVPFGILYECPASFEEPMKLSSMLEMVDQSGGRVLKHSLDQRFELARQIASGLLLIHSIGWVHKRIQPSNVWLAYPRASSHSYPQHLGTAFLAGFDYSRHEVARSTGDEAQEGGWRQQIYQCPSRTVGNLPGNTAGEFTAEHDIYSLGVTLVEIGRWKPLHTYSHLFQNTSPSARKQHLEALAEGLQITMGKRYVNITLRCLRILDESGSSRRGLAIRYLLLDLEDLAIATS